MDDERRMLVIGGPHDGQRVWANPGPTLKLPVYAAPCPTCGFVAHFKPKKEG
jgi:hypothetical protein